ncbi:patatin-like phospholipase family protein [Brevibacillus sp. H7]|uniref:patatin-like phospholipase family protein n=1 Tax=Brevibacillus sp. H7 TaxID=3349138 RepID=UPI00381E976D
MKADAVFEGGGVKGIAFIGALKVMEEQGYEWEKLAGTSAGSIVAALVSAGYRSVELYEVFKRMDYFHLLQRRGLGRIPLVGNLYSLFVHEGMYPSDGIEELVDELLRRKGIRTFGDLSEGKLRIIASDITSGKMLVLPDDLALFGVDPADFPISKAVRMSSSIPFFFQPVRIDLQNQPHYVVDGGLLSNYPVWLFDVPGIPRWPTIGFRLHGKRAQAVETNVDGLFSLTKGLIMTMLDAHDRLYVEKTNAVRTIFIDSLGVRATQFKLSEEVRDQLFRSGEEAARRFLEMWNFAEYIRSYRKKEPTIKIKTGC